MPAKRDALTELAEKMLRALEAQRDLGTSAYPTTFRRLAELADPTADTQTLQKAVKKNVFASRTVVVQAKNLDCPVTFVEDADQLAGSAALLEYLLESLCTGTKPTIEVSTFKKKASLGVREAFGKALDQRIAENALPPGMALIKVKNKLHLHLQRYPLLRKPEEILAEELVKVLRAQRQLSAAAYPTTLTRLIELTRPEADGVLLKKAMAHATFKGGVVQAMKSGRETPIALVGDQQLLADSPLLLVTALQQIRSETKQVFTPANLKAKIVPPLKKAFEESIERRAADGQLPSGVGRLMQNKQKPLLFLISDIVSDNATSGDRTQSAPAAPAASGGNYPTPDHRKVNALSGRGESLQRPVTASESGAKFESAFDEAFRQLDKQSRSHNFVSLLELRRSLPFDRQAIDAGLRELRRAGRYTLSAAEGRHGISSEEQDAGITEDGGLLLYVSRKLL